VKGRRLLAASVLALAVALTAWPSSASGHAKFSGLGADASWYLGDDQNTAVYISVFDGSSQSGPGRAQRSKDVFVDVYQAYCDTEADEFVQREFFTYEPAGNAVISISKKLDRASASGTVDLIGTEYRIAGCDFEKGDEPTINDLGEFVTSISVSWSGVGNTARYSDNFHFNTGPDCKFSSHSSSKYREGTAIGTIDGDLSLGSLGTSDYADMFSSRAMSIEIGSGCFIE
jgi:hypothetical protein